MKAIVLWLAAMPAIARAQPEPISLADAVRVAVDHNPGLVAQRIDVAAAADRVVAARGALDWRLAADVRWDGTRARSPGASSDDVTATASLLRPFAGGGSIALRSDTTISRASAPALDPATGAALEGAAPLRSETADVIVELRQPLLRGWGGDTAPATAIARTEATHDVARLEAEAGAAGVVRDVVRAYWEVAYARDDLAIRRASLELAREQLRVTRARVASGRISGSETLAVGQAIALHEDEVAQAEVALAARSLDLAHLLGREVAAQLLYDPADRMGEARERDVAREIAAALERSPELAAMRARGKAATLEVDVTANGRLPALDLVASAGVQGAAGSARAVWRSVAHHDTAVYAAELQLTIPLGGGAARGAHDAARQAVRRAKIDERTLVVQIEGAIVQATTALAAARRRIAVLDEAVALADRAIDAERARWEEGKSNNYEVMKRQAEREDSALRRARARADLLAAEAELDALTGAILPRYHVALAR
jgi:outer membrane protein